MNYANMNLNELRTDLIVNAHKGYPFFLSGACYWSAMGVLYFIIGHEQRLALFYLIGTGLIFPLAVLIGRLLHINLLSKNPLGVLSGIIGGLQAFYMPVWIIIYIEHYRLLPMMIGILVASHFVPYLWIYQSKIYAILTVSMAVISFLCGYLLIDYVFLSLPFLMALLYVLTAVGLRAETKTFLRNAKKGVNPDWAG
jgi:hypothetical protein